jgi:hypothetical protein
MVLLLSKYPLLRRTLPNSRSCLQDRSIFCISYVYVFSLLAQERSDRYQSTIRCTPSVRLTAGSHPNN